MTAKVRDTIHQQKLLRCLRVIQFGALRKLAESVDEQILHTLKASLARSSAGSEGGSQAAIGREVAARSPLTLLLHVRIRQSLP